MRVEVRKELMIIGYTRLLGFGLRDHRVVIDWMGWDGEVEGWVYMELVVVYMIGSE